MHITQEENDLIARLEADGRFRVLEVLKDLPAQLGLPQLNAKPDNCVCLLAIDTETTGLNPSEADVFEIGYVPVYISTETGLPVGVGPTGNFLNDPGYPIEPERLIFSGRTQEEITGKSWDTATIVAAMESADLIVAHAASFDRPFVEKHFPVATHIPWGCSLNDVDWKKTGLESTKLEFIGLKLGGFVYEGHQASTDAQALVLGMVRAASHPSMAEQEPPFTQIYRKSQETDFQLFATGAEFDLKTVLQQNGYKWSDGSQRGMLKAWFKSVSVYELADELRFLKTQIYQNASAFNPATIGVRESTGLQRYSHNNQSEVQRMRLSDFLQEVEQQQQSAEVGDAPAAAS